MIDKNSINQFIADNNPRAITQTGWWLDVEKADGQHSYIVYTIKGGQITSSALLIKHLLGAGKNYLYCPYGPVVKKELDSTEMRAVASELMDEIKKYVDLTNTIFIRFEPFYQDCHQFVLGLNQLGFKATNQFTQPKDTRILHLLQSEETIFQQMKQKTRYNIRLADKRHVRIDRNNSPTYLKIFYELLLKTCDRDHFRPHPFSHYQHIIQAQSAKDNVYIYNAYYENKVIASIMVTFFGKVATYLHGASSNKYRNLMPTYSLQWRAIHDAIKSGCRFYDFGGIAPEGAPTTHPWQGITRFKEGFGGTVISTTGHLEKTLSPFWHTAYRLAKFIQK